MPKVLVVEDDKIVCETLVNWLKQENYTVQAAHNGDDALNLLTLSGFDAVIMDWDLPGLSGVEVISRYRRNGGQAPVLMLTGKDSISDKEEGFRVGSDDYLTKPFHPKEFSMRVHALIRRSVLNRSELLQLGPLTLDPEAFAAKIGDVPVNLTRMEFRVLEYLMRNQGRVMSAQKLLDNVWCLEDAITLDSVRMCISRLRSKLKKFPACPQVVTASGGGYTLSTDDSALPDHTKDSQANA
jgi:DNA-binding response OmpR family regulator